MHKYIIIILLLCQMSIARIFAQQSAQFDELVSQGHAMIFKDINLALDHADSILGLAYLQQDQRNLGLAHDLMGRVQVYAGQLDQARPNFDMALHHFEGYHDSLTIKTIRNLGLLHHYNDQLDSAILLSQKAAEYYEKNSNYLETAKSYANIGAFLTSMERPRLSIEATFKAINFFKKAPDADYHIGRMFVNLGSQYSALDRFEQSKEYYLKALQTGFDSTDLVSSTLLYSNLGSALWRLGAVDSAEFYLQKALTLAMESGNLRRTCAVYRSIGRMYMGLGQYEEALTYIEQSITKAKKGPYPDLLHSGKIELAECKMSLGKLEEAEQDLKAANEEVSTYNLLFQEARYGLLAELNEKKGDLNNAYLNLLKRLEVSDSIKGLKLQQQIDELRTQYEVQEKEDLIYEQRIDLASAEERYQSRLNTVLITSFIIIVAFLGGMNYLRYHNHKKSKLLLSSQIDLIKNQLSPHFLYNSLNILSNLIAQDMAKAKTAITQLRALYQRMLHSFGHDLVPVTDELAILQAYFDLMVHRFGESVKLKLNIKSKVNQLVVPFTFQMLVENAVKHNSITNGLTICIHEEEHHFVVENNISQTKSSSPFSTQKGLKLLTKKYRLLGNKALQIEHLTNKFIVKVPKIPAFR